MNRFITVLLILSVLSVNQNIKVLNNERIVVMCVCHIKEAVICVSGESSSRLPDHSDRHRPGAGISDGRSLPLQIHQEELQDTVQQPVRPEEGEEPMIHRNTI